MHVEIDRVTKVFGTLRANDGVSLSLEGGRIYAIVGENGAGKSTLMKILSGFMPTDSGQILIDGRPATYDTPAGALARGIGMLHQDPLDVHNLTALENFILGGPESLLPDRRSARKRFVEQAQRLGFTLSPDTYVDQLTIGERQQLEIVRLLSLGAKLIILDEPTTGISAEQKDMLFGSLKRLACDAGLTVVLVSHKLEDVEALCDEVYVLRRGHVVGHRALPLSTSDLVALMFGGEVERAPRVAAMRGPLVLQVCDLTIPSRRLVVHDLTLDVYAGEVVGLAGLDGSGQREFVRACAGLQAGSAGRILVGDQAVTGTSYHRLASRGVAFAPAGRLEEGLVPGLTVTEHFALVTPGGLWIDYRTVQSVAEERIARYNIRGRPEHPVQTLSGGNQQRLLIAMLPPDLKLLLLEDPTRGLDVESTAWVWRQLLERRNNGTAIVFISPDLDEIMEYSDRIAVFCDGRVTVLGDPSTCTVEQLGRLIGGKSA
jgi:simple sugar transport system ATP-binding protein